ncbi:ABC transporter permease [Paenibacillus endoradicis]|uniref:ABC transporter permease n=1 Tax=Paenibacillus endoradicis TaxID=2972487 RepID=UPI00215916E0|nr:ABC transporter permease [Paenibacillus endoradicis]
MNNFMTVVRFTLFNKLKGKPFLISTIVFLLIISAVIHIPFIMNQFDSGDKVKTIGYSQSTDNELAATTGKQLQEYFTATGNSNFDFKGFASTGDATKDEEQLKKALNEGELYSYIVFGKVTESGFPEIIVKSEKLMEFSIASQIETGLQVIRQQSILSQSGLTDDQWKQLQAPIVIDSVQIGSSTTGEAEGKDAAEQGVNMGVIYFIIVFLFMAVMISGQMIASEVTAEKSSRVMEVLITSVSPLTSMFGKITGMFLLVLSQLALYIGVGLINLNLPHNKEVFAGFNIDLSLVDPMLLVFAVLYFLTGFFLFATLYAALGSIVSRTEDLGQAVMPMTFISLAGFYIAIFSISTPDSLLVKICSFIPLFSPFVMVLRIGLTDTPMWEVLLSLGILVVTIYLTVLLSAKIYRTGVLMYGKRPSWKELRKAMKAYKI